MDPSQPNSREDQRKVIDAEIKLLEESLRVLKHRRNALAPVSSLPTEVIATIFSFSRVTVSASGFTSSKKSDPLAWLRLAHICHQWREIAFNQPLFWSHVNFTALSSAGVSEVLARAKTVPLHLEARFLDGNWNNDQYCVFQEALQGCISRACHLLVSADSYHLRKTLDRLVSPAPALETLSLFSEEESPQPDVSDTVFSGTTPRLSFLELRNCNISWKSPLLKGLIHLDICSPSKNAIPSLSVWLDALNEMSQLKMLGLHVASPEASSLPFHAERTVTLPSLTELNISDYPRNCGFALAHLELPTLTCLCVQTCSSHLDGKNVIDVLPYIARHARTQPLQSLFVQCKNRRMDILAWPVPDIDAEVHESPVLPTAIPSPHVALRIWSKDWIRFGNHLKFLDMVMAILPFDDLVTLIVQDLMSPRFEKFWHLNSLKWPLLRRVRLTPILATSFTNWLLADNGGCENPLLPSLKELVLVGAELDEYLTLDLCDTLMKRVEHGVPLEMLDLRTCLSDNPGAVQLLSEIVVDVLGPEETFDARAQIRSIWDRFNNILFVDCDDSREANELDESDDSTDSDTGGDDEEE